MRRPLLLILWLLTDYLLFLGVYAFAYFQRVGWIFSGDLPFRQFMIAVAVSGVPWLAGLVTTRTFSLTRRQRTPRNAIYIGWAAVMGAALVTTTYFFLYQQIFSRELLLTAFVLSAIATWGWHMIFGLVMRMMLRGGSPCFPTLIVGVTRESRHLIGLLQKRRSVFAPVAILDASGVKDSAIEGVPVVGKLNKLEEVLRSHSITHLIHCSDVDQSINLLSACRARGITYMLLPSVLGIVEKDERTESLEGKAVTVVSPERAWWQWFFR